MTVRWSEARRAGCPGVISVVCMCRYEKLVRSLPQTPWVLRGERLMDSSVQEIIFAPLAKLFG